VVAGVCGGLSRVTGIDVTLVRIGFVLLALGSGVGILAYALAWLLLPLDGESTNILSRSFNDKRGLRLVIAIIPVVIVVQLVAGALHVGFAGALGWPLLVAVGAFILIRRNASETERAWINEELLPLLHTGRHRRRWTTIARVALGLVLTAVGLYILIADHAKRGDVRPVIGALVVIAALVVVLGPWWLSLLRDLLAERQARVLAEERAEMAAHVHDSVLQTLALIQRAADDPQNVIRLARAQERELRSWLFEGRSPGTIGDEASTLAEGIAVIQSEVEAMAGITVQTVVVGDCRLDDRLRGLLDAAREATVNAAKWSGAAEVSLYAEMEENKVTVYVRDRGCGFDPDAVSSDRQGIAQSIRARMVRLGGSSAIRSAPGRGTEVELSMSRAPATA
jgi:signal transduction histidine kinase/phage shock protein PspC (stress-responsive transcriptional regulator)